jgi:Abnormal spindle-like microcephaly-assoc'd, ASPM-SPD-2-Hydin/HYDIN/CFA65/VesB-like, Ig-like domain
VKALRSRCKVLALLLAVSTLLGCQGLEGRPSPDSTSQALIISNTSVDFGTVVVGNSQVLWDSIYNPMRRRVTVSQVLVSGAGFRLVNTKTPFTIGARQRVWIQITFTPQSSGSASGTIAISSSAPEPSVAVSLAGDAISAGQLVPKPSKITFGSVRIGGSLAKSGSLTNNGDTSVTVSQVAVSGSNFTVGGMTLPITLAPNQSTAFSVTFRPRAGGTTSSNIVVTTSVSLVAPQARATRRARPHDSTETTTVTIPVAGTGAAGGQLDATPGTVSFGSAQVGSSQSKPVTVTNSGTSSVTINSVTASGSGFSVKGMSTPMTVAAGQSMAVNCTFTPQSAGAASGSLSISSDASDPTLSVPLSGTGAAAGSLTAGAVSFGSVTVGSTQKQSVTITNSGSSSVTISQATASGTSFSMSGLTLPITLAGGQSTAASISFAPQAAGSASGDLTITSDASNPTLVVALSGTGAAAGSLTAGAVSFGSVIVGNTQKESVTITNSGGSSVTISQATASGAGFSVSGMTLPVTVAAGQSTTANLSFAPQAAGAASGILTVTSNASTPTLTVPLSATAVAPGALAVSPSSLSFGSVATGSSQTLQASLTNSGGSSVTISQAAFSGTGFNLSGLTLPLTLAAGKSTAFSVVFSPQSSGNASANLTLTSDGSNPTLVIPVSATATAAGSLAASPASIPFGSVQVGSNSTQQATLTNSGGTSVTVSQANVTGSAFSLTGLSLPLTLSAGQSFTFTVEFAPQSAGSASGSLALVSSAAGTAPSISLSGTGTATGQFSLTPTSLNFGSVTVGSNKSMTLTLGASGASVTVSSASVSSPEFAISGSSLPLTIQAGQSATLNLIFTPQSSGTATATASFVTVGSTTPVVASLTGSGAAAAQHSVDLSWSASSSSSVAGYNVYRGSTSGGPYSKLNSSPDDATSYTDSAVQAGQTYFYVTTAVGSDGTESSYSNQVTATIPSP